ncbi:hypothetical protein Ccrd_003454 [Cynara cardunculus var. scolymus]|uniref:Uncharacterized protein n=1 Tax=Cynara cardunculus var. scolymus TaxID=59895 RepID=A0A103XPL3_CYNCS|nr:hypothetical protein Ccrd_003454 [Cynara cardunculus var. scolymus]
MPKNYIKQDQSVFLLALVLSNVEVPQVRYLFEKLLSEVTEILFFSRVIVTESPRLPALPPTLILSCRNFSSDAISMILSSTGFPQSMTKVAPFFFPPFAPAPPAPRLIFASLCLSLRLEQQNQQSIIKLVARKP